MTETTISSLALLVHDYDEAIDYFTNRLGFTLLEDTALGDHKRWVRVAPPGGGCALLLARAADDEQRSAVGKQGGGRVFLFMQSSNFWESYRSMKEAGVNFLEEPREEPYGCVCVFADLYGNRWDLLGAAG
ncbi:MAG: VOC family protein [Pseudomonadota bacterium]